MLARGSFGGRLSRRPGSACGVLAAHAAKGDDEVTQAAGVARFMRKFLMATLVLLAARRTCATCGPRRIAARLRVQLIARQPESAAGSRRAGRASPAL